jgi:NAD(P)-dependent dehydrogenase (short-subunit alcohol dehydrogenase family)
MVTATTGVLQNADPAQWKQHRYGVPIARWEFLKDKAVWITGAGTGFGRSLAVGLASAGCTVFLSGQRESKLQETLEEMHLFGIATDRCHSVPVDVTDAVQMERACDRIRQSCPSLFGLIHSAALPQTPGANSPLQNETLETWNRILQTNVTAPWRVTQSIFPHMKKGPAVRILFLTSEAGWAFTSGFGPYNLSKAALNNLTGSLAEELQADCPDLDLQVNGLNPGEARTEMNPHSPHSPYTAVSMAVILLSHLRGGPNGKFFHRDGRHLDFTYALKFEKHLL